MEESIEKFKRFGSNKGLIFLVNEEKLDLGIIEQLRNYLLLKEKELKKKRSQLGGKQTDLE